ncbi:MAG: hypothetical protein WC975_00640 [Phycisphaerae bacterium]
METMDAAARSRLVQKHDRFFTGSREGRVIEILQTACRAGATKVAIINRNDRIIVRDNGRGIADFSTILDRRNFGGEENREAYEYPPGVGLLCLAPRELIVRSRGKRVRIGPNEWTGQPLAVRADPGIREGTELEFPDDPWTIDLVEINAVFSGMRVSLDGRDLPSIPFVDPHATVYPELGCRLAAVNPAHWDPWHERILSFMDNDNVLVNFGGEVVGFEYRPAGCHDLHYRIDCGDDRMIEVRRALAARRQGETNDVLERLKAAIEREGHRYIRKHGVQTLRTTSR